MQKHTFNKGFSQNIKLLSFFYFFNSLRFYAAILIIYFAQITGSLVLAIAVFSVVQISKAIIEVPAGVFSDRFGRKPTLVLGVILSISALTLYASGISYPVLIIGAILTGASNAFFSGNNDALLYESLVQIKQEDSYHKKLGDISAMESTALLISGVIGGIIATWSFPVLLWISVVPQIFCLVLSLQLKEPVQQRDTNDNIYADLKVAFKLFKTNIKLRRLSIADIITFGVGESTYRFESVFFNTLLPLWAVTLVQNFGGILGIVSFKLSGKVISKYKAINVLIVQESSRRIINIIALAFPTILSPIVMTLNSLTYGFGSIARSSLLQKEFESKQRSTMSSINSLFGSMCYVIVAIPLGYIADIFGPAKAMLVGQFLILPSIFLYWKIFKSNKEVIRANS